MHRVDRGRDALDLWGEEAGRRFSDGGGLVHLLSPPSAETEPASSPSRFVQHEGVTVLFPEVWRVKRALSATHGHAWEKL